MKPWQFVVVGVALAATSGCRSDPTIPILERQLRLQEDEIYRLRATIEDLQDSAAEGEKRVSSKRGESESRATSERGSRSNSKASEAESADIAPPTVEFHGPASSDMPSTLKGRGGPAPSSTIPDIPDELRGPSPSLPDGEKDNGFHPRGGDASQSSDATSSDGPDLGGPSGVRGASRGARGRFASHNRPMRAVGAAGDNSQVASITLDRDLTGGINDGSRAGDRGLLVVVEPRDAKGRAVDAPAEISVAVLDPAVLDEEGNAVRVARWDFSAAEIAQMFRRTSAGPAIHIETDWPAGPPAHSKLHVFVRYVTDDHRDLRADRPIEVALAGEPSIRQTQPMPAEPSEQPADQNASQPDSTARRVPWSPERR